jgi:hypothetical protein
MSTGILATWPSLGWPSLCVLRVITDPYTFLLRGNPLQDPWNQDYTVMWPLFIDGRHGYPEKLQLMPKYAGVRPFNNRHVRRIDVYDGSTAVDANSVQPFHPAVGQGPHDRLRGLCSFALQGASYVTVLKLQP